MRKIIYLFLSIVFVITVFSFSSCGDDESQSVSNDTSGSLSVQTEEDQDSALNDTSENLVVQSEDDLNSEFQGSGNLNDEGVADDESEAEEITIDSLVDSYNSVAENQLVYVEDFEVQNKESGHYRTEFRLGAYEDAIGKSYSMNGKTVDIISRKDMADRQYFRVYAHTESLDSCIELIKFFSPLLDTTISDTTVKEAIDYVNEKKEANGYYYGELGLDLLGNDIEGYNLMIKSDY